MYAARFSRVGNRFPVLAEFLWVLLPTFLEGFCVRGSLSVGLLEGPRGVKGFISVGLLEGPLAVKGFVSVGTDSPNAARTKPNLEGSRVSSRTIGETPPDPSLC